MPGSRTAGNSFVIVARPSSVSPEDRPVGDDERERGEHERDRERVEVRPQGRADEDRLGDEQPRHQLAARAGEAAPRRTAPRASSRA